MGSNGVFVSLFTGRSKLTLSLLRRNNMSLIQSMLSTTTYRAYFGITNLSINGSIRLLGLDGGLDDDLDDSLTTIDTMGLMTIMLTKVIKDHRRSANENIRVTNHGECHQRQRRREPGVSFGSVYYGGAHDRLYRRVTLSTTIVPSYGQKFDRIFLRVIYWSLEYFYRDMSVRTINAYTSRAARSTHTGNGIAMGYVFSFYVIRHFRLYNGVDVYHYVFRPALVLFFSVRLLFPRLFLGLSRGCLSCVLSLLRRPCAYRDNLQ